MAMSFFGIIFIAMVIGSLIILGPGLLSAVVAHRKGYRPWFWILSSGLVGLLVTVLMPGLGKADTPEQRERWEKRADWTGGLLSGFTFAFMFVLPALGLMFFVGAWKTAPMMRPLGIPAPPQIVVEDEMMTIETPADVIESQPDPKSE